MKLSTGHFHVKIPTEVAFGRGSRHLIVDTLASEGWLRLGVVLDHGLTKVPIVETLLEELRAACDWLILCPCNIQEPTYDTLEANRGIFANQNLDVIIGIGGGSALDMAKGLAVLVHNKETAIHYRGFDRMQERVLPVVAVPTTAGTGSEVTPNASFVDTQQKRKMGINGEAVRPRYAFLDPELTLSCPPKPTLSAALDSLVHATEALVAIKRTPWADMLALTAFPRVFNALPKVMQNPDDIDARENVMFGAFLAGLALMHSGTGPSAALSYPLGVRHGVPHGLGGGIFLPHIIKYNATAGHTGYGPLFDTIHNNDNSLNESEKGVRLADRMLAHWHDWQVPQDLAKLGVSGSKIAPFIQDTLDLDGALRQNPVAFGESQIKRVLHELNVSC